MENGGKNENSRIISPVGSPIWLSQSEGFSLCFIAI